MCLIAYNQPPKIATDDIPIFKYLLRSAFYNTWYTPYTLTLVPLDKILIGKFESPLNEKYHIGHINDKNKEIIVICDGFIHAFTTAFEHYQRSGGYLGQQTLIRGYIPKGTQYHVSIDGSEICAKKIILTFN